MKIAIVGSGFAGAVIACELAKTNKYKIDVFEKRNHIGGNCYTYRDKETNILIHKYGPHIFNTNNEDVWRYVNGFDEFYSYVNRVKAVVNNKVYTMPINLMTINQVFNENLNPVEAQNYLQLQSDKSVGEVNNFEEQALKFVGKKIYEMFFKGYTKKQWGVDPKRLDKNILKRIPVRFNYDDNYYNTKYQGIPINGYTKIIEKMLKNPNIQINLNTVFDKYNDKNKYDYVFFSGPIDEYFNYAEGALNYRCLKFKKEIHNLNDYQGNAVINYCDEQVSYTRITEHKHFSPWKNTNKTVVFKEYSKKSSYEDEKYYPMRLQIDKEKYDLYEKRTKYEKNIIFVGRLGTYKYMNMDKVIEESLEIAKKF